MWRCLLVLAAVAAPARAETSVDLRAPEPPPTGPMLRFAHPGAQVVIERATLALRIEDRQIVGRLVLAVTATYSARDTPLELEVPAGTRITGLAVTTRPVGQEPRRSLARSVAAVTARTDYQAIVEGARDPALLQWLGSAGGRDRLELRVFPLGIWSPAKIELAVVLPRVTELAIDPDAQLIRRLEITVDDEPYAAWTDVHEPRAIALARTAVPLASAPRSLVDETHSLFVGVPPPRIIVDIGPPHAACICGSNRQIRRVVRDHHPQLRYCYEKVLQVNPWLAGTADLAFSIEPDGRVSSARVTGELDHPEVAACLEREVRAWQFPRDDGRTEVHYPLHFRRATSEPLEPE